MAITVVAAPLSDGTMWIGISGVQTSDVYRDLRVSSRYDSKQSYEYKHGFTIPAGSTPLNNYYCHDPKQELRPNTVYSYKVDEVQTTDGVIISTTYASAKTFEATGNISTDATTNSFTVHVTNLGERVLYDRIVEVGYRDGSQYAPVVAREYITIADSETPPSSIDVLFDTADIFPGKQFYAYANLWYKSTNDSLGAYKSVGCDVSIPYANISYALVDYVQYTAPMETATVGGRLYLYQDTLPDTTISLYAQYPENGTQVYRRLGSIPTTGTTTWEVEVDVSWAMESTRFFFWGVSNYQHDGETTSYRSPERIAFIQRLFSWYVPPLYDSIRFEHHDFNKLIQYGRKAHELYPEFFPADFQIEYVDTDDPWLASDATRIGWANRTISPYEPIRVADIQYMMDRMQDSLRRAIRNGS